MSAFADRVEAGHFLALRLEDYAAELDVVIVGLACGGVPVANEVAEHLEAPLDVTVVRKLSVPWQPEFAIGAIASGGVKILDRTIIRYLGLTNYYVNGLIEKEEKEVEKREALFRDGYPAQVLSGRTVVLVDDGAATGATMLAAAEAVRRQNPKKIVVAVPVASCEACAAIEKTAGKGVCLATPERFRAVSQYYESFPQVPDQEVKDALFRARWRRAGKRNMLRRVPDRKF